MDRHINRQTDGQIDKQIDRQTDGHIDGHSASKITHTYAQDRRTHIHRKTNRQIDSPRYSYEAITEGKHGGYAWY